MDLQAEPERRLLTSKQVMDIKLTIHEHCKDWDSKDDEQCKKRKELKKAMTEKMILGETLDQAKSVLES
jgi:hypothetical protein